MNAPWRIRAASLTWRWEKAGRTTGRATALTIRMIRITTRSSMRVKPRGIADCGLRNADCGLRNADCGLRNRLRIAEADCYGEWKTGLQSESRYAIRNLKSVIVVERSSRASDSNTHLDVLVADIVLGRLEQVGARRAGGVVRGVVGDRGAHLELAFDVKSATSSPNGMALFSLAINAVATAVALLVPETCITLSEYRKTPSCPS